MKFNIEYDFRDLTILGLKSKDLIIELDDVMQCLIRNGEVSHAS